MLYRPGKDSKMMITGNRSLVAVILFLVNGLLVAGARPPPSPVTEDTLQEVADSLEMYVDPLPQMPKLFGYSMKDGRPSPGHLTIGMFQKKWKFHRNLPATTVFVYGTSAKTATFPGPTIESLQGTPLSVTWQNHLPNQHILPSDATIPVASPKHGGVPTVVHLHGGIDEPQSDGNSMSWFTSNFSETGATWSKPTCYYTNIQHPGNLWYHDHTLGLTRINLLAGLIGGYIIRNPTIESPFGLPTGDEFDRQLIIVDRSFNTDGSIYMNATGNNQDIHPQWQPEYFGDAIIVNGKAWPYLTVQRRKYRFRIINASNARFLRLSLSNGLLFHVIGSDSAYLRAPVETWSILAAPAEIYDVVVDFAGSDTAEVELLNGAPYPFPGGDLPDLLNGKVMKFIITDETTVAKDLSTVPAKLVEYPKPSKKMASMRRYIALFEFESPSGEPTHLVINQKRFDDPVTETPRAGSTEVWEVINLTEDNHPLHIHLATFQAVRVRSLVDEDGFKSCMLGKNNARSCNITRHAAGKMVVVPRHERTWKNVVKIAPGHVTTVVVRFALLDRDAPYPFDATAEPGYVYHCHILDHEDNAMMRPLKLIA